MQHVSHRAVAVFLTIDETLTTVVAVACSARSALLRSRRILANVLFRSVSKLAVYRNERSRIDFIEGSQSDSAIWIHRYLFEKRSRFHESASRHNRCAPLNHSKLSSHRSRSS